MAKLRRLRLKGFKSIKEMDLEFRDLNVLIGANGAGKSNLISFFKMLNEMMAGRLQQFIGGQGFAQSILHYGPKVTPQMEARLEFETDGGANDYSMRLFHAAGEALLFAEESLSFHQTDFPKPKVVSLGSGHKETRIGEEAGKGDRTATTVRCLLNECRVYHFHDTSPTARVLQHSYVGDSRWLAPDAGNLAAMLRCYRENDQRVYEHIVSTLRMIAPFFGDFVLDVPGTNRDVILNWTEKGSDQVFGPHQLSDGTVRALCLITLLMQPQEKLPKLIIVDEPELGLHPYALNIIASLFGEASFHTQVLISTQSAEFLNSFEPEEIVVVDRNGEGSEFKRLEPGELDGWLEDYRLGEIWAKNVIGGGPH